MSYIRSKNINENYNDVLLQYNSDLYKNKKI